MRESKNTVAKKGILEVLKQSEVALSRSEIQLLTAGLCDRVTIYRVLERIVKEGLAHKILNTDGVVKFAYCNRHLSEYTQNHIHFSCQKCHSVYCLPGVVPSFNLPMGYKIEEANFIVSGCCVHCR